MDVVVTSAGMRACDRHAIERLGVPPIALMEHAAAAVARAARTLAAGAGLRDVTIVCGPGNNGGDGFAAARHLFAEGFSVRVVLAGAAGKLKGDARVEYDVLRKMRARGTGTRGTGARLELTVDRSGRIGGGGRPAVIVDALFGTGLRGPLKGAAANAVGWINRQTGPVLSVDIPSGLDADTGAIVGPCVRADVTVTMGLLKAGLLTGGGPEAAGRIEVAPLGVPMPPDPRLGGAVRRVTVADIPAILPRRPRTAHKHSVGRVLILAGSRGLTGAAALASLAAIRAGAGAVILATPEGVHPVLARKLTEAMVKPVPDGGRGCFRSESFEAIGGELEWADVVLAGPGMGMDSSVQGFLEKLSRMRGKRFLLDADALNHIAADHRLGGILKRNSCILTPHAGELARLTERKAHSLESDRIGAAVAFAKKWKTQLVFKGSPTVTAAPDGRAWINSTGNPGMASAGMGDVLAGMMAALWAESGDPITSSWGGAFLHGEAGDRAADRVGERSLIAGDLLSEIPQLLIDHCVD